MNGALIAIFQMGVIVGEGEERSGRIKGLKFEAANPFLRALMPTEDTFATGDDKIGGKSKSDTTRSERR